MMQILIVDDDASFRRSLSIGLEDEGYLCFEASGVMEALALLRKHSQNDDRIKGVVVDARMPGLDGFWLADQLSILYPYLKVVILSAHAYPEKSGRYSVMTKPIKIPKLKEFFKQEACVSCD